MASELQGKTIAILAADGVEQVELEQPRQAVQAAGAVTELLSIKPGQIQAVNQDIYPSVTFTVDRLAGPPPAPRWHKRKDQTMTATVAEVMVATLKASGVRRVYGIPGDSLNGFTDALRRDGEITWEHVRHEEAAGFAAAADGALSFVELEMKAAGIVSFGTDLANPDFTGIARAAGLFGARVEKASELDDALRAAFTYDGPALVDVRTARQELALPPKLTYGQIKGFTLYATRTILSGEGSELIELTGTNLRELEAE